MARSAATTDTTKSRVITATRGQPASRNAYSRLSVRDKQSSHGMMLRNASLNLNRHRDSRPQRAHGIRLGAPGGDANAPARLADPHHIGKTVGATREVRDDEARGNGIKRRVRKRKTRQPRHHSMIGRLRWQTALPLVDRQR
jgi:hypothetical protein